MKRIRDILSATLTASFLLTVPNPAVAAQAKPSGAATDPTDAAIAISTNTEAKAEGAPDASVENQSNAVTKAQLTLRLTDEVKADQQRLKELQQRLTDPESEFVKAEKAASEVRGELAELESRLANLKEQGQQPAAELKAEQQSLEKKQKLAQERFAAAMEEREALQAQIQALQDIIQQNTQILARLTGSMTPQTNAAQAMPVAVSNVIKGAVAHPAEAAQSGQPAVPPALPGPAGAISVMTGPPGATNGAATNQAATEARPMSRELREAKEEESVKKAEADQAAQDVRLLQDRIIAAERGIQAEQRLLETARKKAGVAAQEQAALEQQLEQKRQAGAPSSELDEIRVRIRDSERRLRQAQTEIQEHESLLERRRIGLADLGTLESRVAEQADAKLEQASEAAGRVKFLESPLHPRNMLQWVLDRGPKIAGILLLMFVAKLVVRFLSHRIVMLLTRTRARGSPEERENRAQTLTGVFQSTATVIIIGGGAMMILDECGVPVGPLLGGAAIMGIAVAFGAQRLVADFFHGFVMLLENQYKVNDVVRVAGISGLVERITTRVTVLRDLEGVLHFIPNSEIKTVSNMTHGWSRALFDIGVAYKENADRVMEILMELGRGLRKDPKFGKLILDDPEMLGLDAMADSAIVIKFFIKTRPLQQWAVKRELLRRIKRRFDELGIEIPFPHRTVYLRADSTPPIENVSPRPDAPRQRPRRGPPTERRNKPDEPLPPAEDIE